MYNKVNRMNDNVKDNEHNPPIGDIAGNVCEFAMKQLPKEMEGAEFVKNMLEIFTLCISETIKAGFCASHYEASLEEVNFLIKTDLGMNES